MQVLVVDDSPLAARILAASLTADGHCPVVAVDAAHALKMLGVHPVDVVISDWEMPGMSGPELCRAIRAGGLGQHIYFLLLTSRDDVASLVEARKAGADDLLVKPLDPDRLSLRMQSIERTLAATNRRAEVIRSFDPADQLPSGGHVRP